MGAVAGVPASTDGFGFTADDEVGSVCALCVAAGCNLSRLDKLVCSSPTEGCHELGGPIGRIASESNTGDATGESMPTLLANLSVVRTVDDALMCSISKLSPRNAVPKLEKLTGPR